jgi:hypothetical protein
MEPSSPSEAERLRKSLNDLVAILPASEIHMDALRKEGATLVGIMTTKAARLKLTFPDTPLEKVMDIARPLVYVIKGNWLFPLVEYSVLIVVNEEMDGFFLGNGIPVPPLGAPPSDNGTRSFCSFFCLFWLLSIFSGITDEKERRVRSMLFMALDKINAQAQALSGAVASADSENTAALMLSKLRSLVDSLV